MFSDQDNHYMQQALALAKKAEAKGEVPVGCVIVLQDKVIGQGYNQPISSHDPSAHAEIMALRAAGLALTNYRLVETTMYVTLEPCAMCAGAIVHARVGRLIYGATDPRTGAAGSVFNLLDHSALNHQVNCSSGLCEQESRKLLQQFFQSKR